jgi:NADPH:quinone reductase-like Zn-dependent oxidoreductase
MNHRAYRIHQYGDESVLQLETLPLPQPGPGQVRVRHTAIGLAGVNVMLSMLLWLVAVWLGSRVGQWFNRLR